MFAASLHRTIAKKAQVSSTTMMTRRWMAQMPVPQSQHAPLWTGHKVAKEGWEESMYFYIAAAFVLQVAIINGAPETSIESWARPEAQARLKLAAAGQTEFEFGKHYQTLEKNQQLSVWEKFADRSTIPGEDDDDDDEEEEEEEEEEEDDEE